MTDEQENIKNKSNLSDCCQPSQPLTSLENSLPQKFDTSQQDKHWITGTVKTGIGDIPVVKTELEFADTLGSWKARWSIGRMKYIIIPGLYAVGNPDSSSPVFVSANYKMSFDRLRSNLKNIDGWIMVLDTKGINVWCAAGKGTFGTDEIIGRIRLTGLEKVVSHRRLILPQLGAPGVMAHKIKDATGFRIIYGPVRAVDIPEFMTAKMKATPEMRKVKFTFGDRIVLIPNDFVQSLKYALLVTVVFFLLSGIGSDIYSVDRLLSIGLNSAIILLVLYTLANILPQTLLPWLPGKSFSTKGAWIGIIMAAFYYWLIIGKTVIFQSNFLALAWLLIIPAVTSFISMNFTGSSTYTSLSGVRKEMKIAVPIQIITFVIGTGLWITGLFV